MEGHHVNCRRGIRWPCRSGRRRLAAISGLCILEIIFCLARLLDSDLANMHYNMHFANEQSPILPRTYSISSLSTAGVDYISEKFRRVFSQIPTYHLGVAAREPHEDANSNQDAKSNEDPSTVDIQFWSWGTHATFMLEPYSLLRALVLERIERGTQNAAEHNGSEQGAEQRADRRASTNTSTNPSSRRPRYEVHEKFIGAFYQCRHALYRPFQNDILNTDSGSADSNTALPFSKKKNASNKTNICRCLEHDAKECAPENVDPIAALFVELDEALHNPRYPNPGDWCLSQADEIAFHIERYFWQLVEEAGILNRPQEARRGDVFAKGRGKEVHATHEASVEVKEKISRERTDTQTKTTEDSKVERTPKLKRKKTVLISICTTAFFLCGMVHRLLGEVREAAGRSDQHDTLHVVDLYYLAQGLSELAPVDIFFPGGPPRTSARVAGPISSESGTYSDDNFAKIGDSEVGDSELNNNNFIQCKAPVRCSHPFLRPKLRCASQQMRADEIRSVRRRLGLDYAPRYEGVGDPLHEGGIGAGRGSSVISTHASESSSMAQGVNSSSGGSSSASSEHTYHGWSPSVYFGGCHQQNSHGGAAQEPQTGIKQLRKPEHAFKTKEKCLTAAWKTLVQNVLISVDPASGAPGSLSGSAARETASAVTSREAKVERLGHLGDETAGGRNGFADTHGSTGRGGTHVLWSNDMMQSIQMARSWFQDIPDQAPSGVVGADTTDTGATPRTTDDVAPGPNRSVSSTLPHAHSDEFAATMPPQRDDDRLESGQTRKAFPRAGTGGSLRRVANTLTSFPVCLYLDEEYAWREDEASKAENDVSEPENSSKVSKVVDAAGELTDAVHTDAVSDAGARRGELAEPQHEPLRFGIWAKGNGIMRRIADNLERLLSANNLNVSVEVISDKNLKMEYMKTTFVGIIFLPHEYEAVIFHEFYRMGLPLVVPNRHFFLERSQRLRWFKTALEEETGEVEKASYVSRAIRNLKDQVQGDFYIPVDVAAPGKDNVIESLVNRASPHNNELVYPHVFRFDATEMEEALEIERTQRDNQRGGRAIYDGNDSAISDSEKIDWHGIFSRMSEEIELMLHQIIVLELGQNEAISKAMKQAYDKRLRETKRVWGEFLEGIF